MELFRRGKVRDTFDFGDQLLMVSTDRVSAYDSVLPSLIPDRGRVLTQMSRYWFGKTRDLVPNHLLRDRPELIPEAERRRLRDRTMLVARAERIDVECVVRGRLAGSGWQEYRRSGRLAEEPVPAGLGFGDPLPEPRFTPATKNDWGHDENISRAQLAQLIGPELARRLEEISLRIFRLAEVHCRESGFTLVDTKFEFGLIGGGLALIDEVLTPDSSRFWELGADPEEVALGFDKQLVRDYLDRVGWNHEPPPPPLPEELVREVRQRYLEACRRICGIDL